MPRQLPSLSVPCMAAWYAKAHLEWKHLRSHDSHCRVDELDLDLAHSFKWTPAVGPVATPACGFSKKATFWRSLARRFEEVAVLLVRASSATTLILLRHVVKAWSKTTMVLASGCDESELGAMVKASTESLGVQSML